MLIRYQDWVRPTDARYAFPLREPAGSEGFTPEVPAVGTVTRAGDTAGEVLASDGADRFARVVARWGGPEDVLEGSGAQPYAGVQDRFCERAWTGKLSRAALEPVLEGCALVMRREGTVDYVLRDHHMVDVVLHHYRTTGELPHRMFHADRHSDWCSDAFLERRTPIQAATWWKLLEGLKRPDGGAVVEERDVHFAWGRAERIARMSGRDLDDSPPVPGFLCPEDHAWERVLAREELFGCEWVSLDLDFFQPRPQLAVSGPMLRDARFRALMRGAKVRVFVLSPQFTNGGDKVEPWVIQGSLSSSVRLLDLLRRM